MRHRFVIVIGMLVLFFIISSPVVAHDPIFGIGPHVLFKDGIETAVDVESSKAGSDLEQALALELKYGVTGDWAMGINLPYKYKENEIQSSSGNGNIAIFTKYRFWRKDSLALQESTAVLLKVITNSAAHNNSPALNKGTTDSIIGLTYGYEGRRWYRWASARYRFNGTNSSGEDRSNKILLDMVGGIRPTATGYLEPDTVWLLELNAELAEYAKFNGSEIANTGGSEWFVSPGLLWTKRNFAIKAGIQFPVYHDLNGKQEKSNYRAKMSFEWHL